MSKVIKTIIGVAVAVAIPFVAPAIATTLATSIGISSLGTVGTAIGGALVGAGLNAAKGALLGEDVGRSALFGAVSGGVGGYLKAASAAGSGSAGGTAASGAAQPGGYIPGTTMTTGAFNPASSGLGGMQGGLDAITPQFQSLGTNFAGAPVTAGAGIGGGSAGVGLSGFSVDSALPMASIAPGAAGAAGGSTPTFFEALKSVPSAIGKSLSNPERMADFVLRGAGMLAGSAMAGDGLTAEELQLVQQQANELRELQNTNRTLFNEKLQQAYNLIGEAEYFDPEYFGLQSMRKAQVQGAVDKRDAMRNMAMSDASQSARNSALRAMDLGIARNTGTAYDQGYNTAISNRLNTRQAGLQNMPGYLPYDNPATNSLLRARDSAYERRRTTQDDIGELFGSLTGRASARV